jgi:type IV pilus assembly protein PilB
MAYKRVIKKRIGELLIENGIITQSQLDQALEWKQSSGELLGEILVKMGFATEEHVAGVVAAQYGIPYIPLKRHEFNKALASIMPKEIAEKYRCFPVDKIGSILTVAMENPLYEDAVKELREITGCKILCYVSTPSEIRDAIREFYKEHAAREADVSPGSGEEGGVKIFQLDNGEKEV